MRFSLPAFTLLFTSAFSLSAADAPAGKLRYNRDIRPILSDKCFACHGPDKNHREADLRLDVREAAVTAKAIVPGNAKGSSIIERILTDDHDDLMPPPEAKKTLTEAEKKILQEWINQGAEYEPHWAYTPLVRPTVPETKIKVAGSNAIDAFIEAELEKKQMAASPSANASTIIRRMSLDLVGLPPTPAEVKAFELAYQLSPRSAIQVLAQRLMKSPHFGERWAVWWLDVARFTDTVGFHGDQNQRVFPYRDYVINAFNANKRFDQFTLEQLAGDLLPNPTPEQLTATAFNRLNMMTREGGAQPKEYLSKYQADRVRTVGGAWLGATLGCCECHDHKFDPYSQHDFYAISAFFGDVKQFGVYSSYGYTPIEELKGWSNDHPFPPEILVESPYLKGRLAKIEKQMAEVAIAAATQAPAGGFESWRTQTLAALTQQADGWTTPKPEVVVTPAKPVAKKKGKAAPVPALAAKPGDAKAAQEAPEEKGPEAAVQADGRILVIAKSAIKTDITLTPGAGRIAAVRIELLPDAAHKGSIELNGAQEGMTVTPQFAIRKKGAKGNTAVTVFDAEADIKEPRYAGTAEVLGIKSGWKTSFRRTGEAQTGVWILNEGYELAEGDTLVVSLPGQTAGCVRVSVAAAAPLKPLAKNWSAGLKKALESSTAAKPDGLAAQTWLMQSQDKARGDWAKLYASALDCHAGKAWTQVTEAIKEPMTVRRLPRGNWMDETGEVCLPAAPVFLAGALKDGAARQTRKDLAEWLTSATNPLTPRAFMNRLWKQFFGNGLSMVTDDLGAQGETPSHPELLDWLACEFRDSGWDIQHMMQLIVTSATYQQSSKGRPEYKDLDPSNRLLSFQNPRRLDAEFVRDNALFAAGLLNLDLGGPSSHPYQPPGYYENLQFPSRDYLADVDDRQWRRGVYMHWQRTFLHPMLANFDAPARDESTCTRNVSNTPQQALTLLNDPTFVEAARVMAEGLPKASDEARLEAIYKQTLARPLKASEKQSLLSFLQSQRKVYETTPEDAAKLLATGLHSPPSSSTPELAAWTSVCRVVLNLHETITRY